MFIASSHIILVKDVNSSGSWLCGEQQLGITAQFLSYKPNTSEIRLVYYFIKWLEQSLEVFCCMNYWSK